MNTHIPPDWTRWTFHHGTTRNTANYVTKHKSLLLMEYLCTLADMQIRSMLASNAGWPWHSPYCVSRIHRIFSFNFYSFSTHATLKSHITRSVWCQIIYAQHGRCRRSQRTPVFRIRFLGALAHEAIAHLHRRFAIQSFTLPFALCDMNHWVITIGQWLIDCSNQLNGPSIAFQSRSFVAFVSVGVWVLLFCTQPAYCDVWCRHFSYLCIRSRHSQCLVVVCRYCGSMLRMKRDLQETRKRHEQRDKWKTTTKSTTREDCNDSIMQLHNHSVAMTIAYIAHSMHSGCHSLFINILICVDLVERTTNKPIWLLHSIGLCEQTNGLCVSVACESRHIISTNFNSCDKSYAAMLDWNSFSVFAIEIRFSIVARQWAKGVAT